MKNNYIPDNHLSKIRAELSVGDLYICDLLAETGFRLDDLLKVRNWQLNKPVLQLRESKTGKIRSTVLPEHLRRKCGNPLAYAFATSDAKARKRKIHRTTFYRHFIAAVKRAGLDGLGYTPHSLRKVYAVNLYKACRDLKAVRANLGHELLSTTCLYLIGVVDHPESL